MMQAQQLSIFSVLQPSLDASEESGRQGIYSAPHVSRWPDVQSLLPPRS